MRQLASIFGFLNVFTRPLGKDFLPTVVTAIDFEGRRILRRLGVQEMGSSWKEVPYDIPGHCTGPGISWSGRVYRQPQ